MKIFALIFASILSVTTVFCNYNNKGEHVICDNDTITILKLLQGRNGRDGRDGSKGDVGPQGAAGKQGQKGKNGAQGPPGKSCSCQLKKIDKDILVHLLNDYYVAENRYYNNLYHVTSRVLTDGRADTGGWGSKAASAGNWLQATFIRPVYVETVSVAGGFIPSWNHAKTGYGQFYLQHSNDGLKWVTARTIPKTVGTQIATYPLPKPVIAQYWRLTSVKTWVATTEFALKPLIKT